MIIVNLSGGLGNQMFQYAFGKSLAIRHSTELKLDLDFFQNKMAGKKGHVVRNFDLDIFNVHEQPATAKEIARLSKRFDNDFLNKVANKVLGNKSSYIIEPHFHFSPAAYNAPDNVYISGYWQSEKYFAETLPAIRSAFTFNEAMTDKAKELLATIKNTNSVCVNVRRGDFVTNSFHGSFGSEYFDKANEVIKSKLTDHTYFVFSDEVDWCEANLKFDAPTVFVSHDFAGRKFQDYLRLMAACRHFIVPNSSFAWWATWFNENPNKIVIAPEKWFNDPNWKTHDLIPKDWIRI